MSPDPVDWEQVLHLLLVRSGGRCEARTPSCLGRSIGGSGGHLDQLTRRDVNIHHRRPRGTGGTSRTDVHDLSNLLYVCGRGNVTGCHGHLERDRDVARERGYLVRKEGVLSDPANIPVVLASGRAVLLDRHDPLYTVVGYVLTAPPWNPRA